MSLLYIEVIVFFISLCGAALFSFVETSFTALRLYKLKELERGISKYKILFQTWETNPQRILITVLVANNFASILSSVLITEIMQKLFGGGYGLAVGVPIATVIMLVFGEIIPKTFAKTHHEDLFISSLRIVNFLFRISYPMVSLLLRVSEFFFTRFGGTVGAKQEAVSEKELEFLIDYSDEKGIIEAEKGEMLQNVFGLGETCVNEIMIPKFDIVSISTLSTVKETMEVFSQHRYSRLPVYEGREDNFIGFVYQKDTFVLLHKNQEKSLKELIRPIAFVPESKRCNQLLSEFLEKRMHIAIVIDEFGGVVGLVTLEDVLEEIVGEIRDEHEKIHLEIIALEDDGGWLVDGGICLEKIEELLDLTFEVENSVTIAGFLAEQLQHLPRKGERVIFNGFCFQVQQASPRRVFQVLIFKDKDNR